MRSDKPIALELRKTGKSYNEISRQLRVSKSTLSEWLKGHRWSQDITANLNKQLKQSAIIRIRYLNKIRGEHLRRVYEAGKKEAVVEFERLKYHPLFIAGVMAYWGEGDKVSRFGVRIANTDPAMIRLFVTFLRDVCQIKADKIYAGILVYPDLDEKLCRKFWIEKTGLRESNFIKSTVIQGRHKTRRVRYGICNAGLSSAYFKQKMLIWIDLLSKQLISKGYYSRP